jgi:hypothetical protein
MLPLRTSPTSDFFGNVLSVGDKVWLVFSEEPNPYSGIEDRHFHLGEIKYLESKNEETVDAVFQIDYYDLPENLRLHSQSRFRTDKSTCTDFASCIIKAQTNNTPTEPFKNLAPAFSNQSVGFNEEDL